MLHFLIRLSFLLAILSAIQSACPATYAVEFTKPFVPKHLRVSWISDPATAAIVSWSTLKPSANSSFQYRLKNTGGDYSVIKPIQGRFEYDNTELHYHHANLSGLEPGTAYEFQIT